MPSVSVVGSRNARRMSVATPLFRVGSGAPCRPGPQPARRAWRYGESCNAIRTRIFEECHWQSTQHFRLKMSLRYQAYVQMSDAHLAQVHIELEKRVDGDRNADVTQTENFGLLNLARNMLSSRRKTFISRASVQRFSYF